MNPALLKELARDAAQVVHAFAWKKGLRGGQYWLPDGAQDVPANRLYGKAAQAAAAAAKRQGRVRRQKQQGGAMPPKAVERGLVTGATADSGAILGDAVGGPLGGVIGGLLGAALGWDSTAPAKSATPAKKAAARILSADQKELARRRAMLAKRRKKA